MDTRGAFARACSSFDVCASWQLAQMGRAPLLLEEVFLIGCQHLMHYFIWSIPLSNVFKVSGYYSCFSFGRLEKCSHALSKLRNSCLFLSVVSFFSSCRGTVDFSSFSRGTVAFSSSRGTVAFYSSFSRGTVA